VDYVLGILGNDQQSRLKEACEVVLNGSLTPKALRREAQRGNLEIIRVANKDFVTPAAIKEMVDRCRAPSSRPASRSKPSEAAPPIASSETEANALRQASLQGMLEAYRRPEQRKRPTAP
jgi:hypothetical protein